MHAQDIGKLIHYYRKKSGLTQHTLARIAGVGKTVIFDIEKGKKSIRFDTLLKVCAVLNIQITFTPPFLYEKETAA